MADTVTYTMDDVLMNLHQGAWWNYTDWNDRTYANLRVSEGFDYTLPTEEELNSQVTQLQAEYDSQAYARSRKTEYPTIVDQLDDIFHNGIDGWKATIQVTKDKYPKE
tara:strand:+ start:631 stop:954 length:324 start_codon:yes stop_codon:yes gene_type:complete